MDFKSSNIEQLITYSIMGVSLLIGLVSTFLLLKKRKLKTLLVTVIIFIAIIPTTAFLQYRAKNTPVLVRINDESIKVTYKRGNAKTVFFNDFQSAKIITKSDLLGGKYKDIVIIYSDKNKKLDIDTYYFKDANKLEKKIEQSANLQDSN